MAGIMRRKGEKRVYTGREEVNTGEYKGGALRAKGQSRSGLTVGETVGYAAKRAGTDFLRVGEGVVDAALVPIDLITGNVEQAKSRFLDSPVDAMRERLDREYNPGKVAGFIGDIAGGIGQSVGYGLISAIPYAGQPMMYSSIIEQSISSAAEKTGEVGLKEVGYGATAGAVEGLLESKLGAGVSAAKGIGSAILKKTGINVAESAAKAGGKTMLKSVLTETAKGAAGEFAEEAISEAVDPALLSLYNIDENAQFSLKDVAYAGLIGGLSGGMMSAGPAAINYRSSVSVGRALQESGMDGDLINRAKYTLSALEAAQTRSTSQIKGKPEGDTKETAKEWLSRTAENRKVKRLSRETKELADKVRKNIDAYEKYRADPKMSNSEPVAALLGELRGNLFLVGYAYEADVIEQVMMDATDEQRQAFVDAVNEELKKQGKKHDYTLADFDANKDDIRRGLAGLLMADEMQGYTVKYGAEATESPVEPAQAPQDTTAEEVADQEENAATEDLSGIEEEVWRAVTDETVKGYGTQNEQEEALLRAAVSQNVPEKSIPLMLERFREGTDMTPAEFADAWADGVLLFGRLGLNEKKISQESALSRMSEKARHASIEYGKYLSEEQRAKEQEAAKKKKRPVKEGASKKPKGEVVRHPGINLKEDLDDAQFTAYKAAEIMAPALKADIEIHKGLKRDGKEVNGYYDLKTNTIHVNINAVRDGKHIALYTLGHEVTHYIKEWSPKKFYELGDYVMDQLGEGAEKAVRDKLDFLKKNDLVKGLDETEAYDRAYEEVVADGMELVLTDGTVLNELARENKTLWQKIKDRIFEIIEKIKKAYGDLSKTSRTAQILSETMDSLDEIEQLFYEGVREAGERTRTAGVGEAVGNGNEIIYSSTENFKEDKYFKSQMAKWENLKHGSYVKVGTLGEGSPLCQVGMPSGTIRYDVDKLKRNMTDHDDYLTVELLNEIPNILANPVAISEYSQENTISVFGDVFVGKSPMMVGVTISHDRAGNEISKVRTYNTRRDVGNLITDETVLYLGEDKKRTREWFQACGIQVPLGGTKFGFIRSIAQRKYSVNSKFSISENIPSTLSAEDQNLLFDADFYERYENESREPITETVEELEAAKASEAFATMSDDEAFDLNAKLKAKRAGYDTVYDYYVETEKERMAEEYRRYVQTGRSNRTSRTLEEKRKKAQKERTLRSNVDSATPLQNAQYQIIQETNPMWDEYHTGIRSPKEIKTFAEVAEDPDSFTWGDFTREDARKALRDGTVRVYSSYAIKNGVFVSTSYQQALEYAGNDPARVHSRVVALDSVAWINGDEGQYAKVYKDDGIRYSIDETPETPDVSDSAATDRDMLLAMAEKLVGSEEENRILTNYKSHYDTQKSRQAKLDELTAEMREQQSTMMYGESAERRSAAAKRLPAIYKEMSKISEQLADADRKLTEIEGMKAIRNLLKREYAKAREIQKNIYDTRAKVKREAAETTELRRKTRRIYNRVLRLLVSPNRKRNIPYELQGIAAEALKTANMDIEAMERLEKLEQELTALEREAVPNPEKIAQKEEEIEAQEKKVGKTKDHLQVMIEIFEKAKNIKEGVGRSVYDEAALAKLKDLQSKIGNTTIGKMNREQLQALKDFYDILYTRISNANKMLSEEREATVEEYGSKATTEASDAKSLKFLSPKSMELKGMANVRQFFWKNMKPLTVFEAIGSDTFTRLFQSVLNGENVWARDIEEARKKIVETREKYGYDKWELDKRVEVKDKDGKTVRLSLSEMMSLYAYTKRKQAMGHLEGGGFVLDPGATEMAKGKVISFADMERRLNHAERHVVDQLIIGEIASKLTAEQKAYVDEMQTYLTKLGERGNTVSRKLYGIDIFTEEYYFPIKVQSEYLESHTGRTGDPNIKNRGMTKEVTPEADNPLVLQGFDAVMVDHINSMATYHAFVLPVEDLTRVLNYKPSNAKIDEDGNWTVDESRKDYSTLKAVIEEKYGAEANHYIEQLIRDLNGGARRDAAATLLDKGITGFKRASTMASLSVLFQQPTSLIRAAAYIDPKYLFGQASIVDFANHKKLWERLCKYAPVGIIKEMGGYDTGVGARTGDYLNAKVYKTPKEKWEAFLKPERFGGDSNYRAEVFGRGAAYADEMAWIQMFEACVSEQADKLGKSRDSEEVLQAAGKRFEDVVRRTQVYDSTLTRTEFMRSKDTGMKMFTAFMAEPSTVVSMVADAIIKGERGDTKFWRRTAAAVLGSVVLNAMASSLIYAMRDDDEDKSYGEKYLSTLAMETAEAINFAEYLPFTRDIMSLVKGYEVERSDMALIGDLVNSIRRITSNKQTVGQKMESVGGAVAAFFGLPVTNVMRDVNGAIFTFFKTVDTERFTGKGLSVALKEEFDIMFGVWDDEIKNGYQLYQSKLDGDEEHYNRVAARYESQKDVELDLRRALRSFDPRIHEAAEARLSGDLAVYESIVDQIESEGIFDRGIVIRAINNEMLDLKDEDTSKLVPKDETVTDEEETAESLYKASDLNNALERGDAEDFAAILAALVQDKVSTGKTEAQARASVKSSITAHWKKLYIEAWSRGDTEERKRIIAILTETGLYGSRNDVATLAQDWVKNSK